MKIAFVSLMRVVAWGGSEELWYKTALLALAEGDTVESLTYQWPATPEKISHLQRAGVSTKFYQGSETSLLLRAAVKLRLRQDRALLLPAVEADVYVISNGSTWDFVRFRYITDQLVATGKPLVLISQHAFEYGDVLDEPQRHYALRVVEKVQKFWFVSARNLASSMRQLAHGIPRAAVISNPLNTREQKMQPYPATTKLLLACVARVECGVKGQDILLEALSDECWAARDYELTFYGTGPHLDHLRNLIALYGLENKVKLAGQASDIDQIWKESQVLVLPSLSEGTPLALVEAMLSGRAALATDVGDISRYVLEGETGFLIPTASVKCIREGLERLWAGQGELAAMGKRAFDHATQITDFRPEATLLHSVKAALTNE